MRKLVVHMTKQRVEIPNMTCSAMLERLNGHDFLQYSRGGILNRNYIEYVDEANRYVKMKNGAMLEIGRVTKKRFMSELRHDS